MIYQNRYKDEINFTEDGDHVTMTGGIWLRYGYNDDQEIIMVDPSGGPYLEVGQDLIGFFRDGVSRIIEGITIKQKSSDWEDSVDVVFKIGRLKSH